jgi:poly(A) polymerase
LIKKFIRRVLRFGRKAGPQIIPKSRHGISRDQLSSGSLRVCDTLQEAGHEAYVVGGAVRDLILGVRPKDFDVATSAPPETVHKLFRRSRLIGRRFKIAHVMFGAETVEVSTFRSGDAEDKDEHGRVLRDNAYGTREQDAARRDFTTNALYYDASNETVVDFHGGMKDLNSKTVRIIGDPKERFREDPVRMLRAVRFAAKLGFKIDEATRAPIRSLGKLIENVPPARIFDEMQKLLLSGHAKNTLHRLHEEGLHHGVLPLLDVILEQPLGTRFVNLALADTDRRALEGKPVSPAFLFAALFWHEVLAAWKAECAKGAHPVPALHKCMDEVLDAQTEKLAIPRRFTTIMKEIWLLQPRFEQRNGKRPFATLTQERFRAGFDFLLLRAQSGEVPMELGEWWERFQSVPHSEQMAMLVEPEGGTKDGTRRRRRRKPRAEAPLAP